MKHFIVVQCRSEIKVQDINITTTVMRRPSYICILNLKELYTLEPSRFFVYFGFKDTKASPNNIFQTYLASYHICPCFIKFPFWDIDANMSCLMWSDSLCPENRTNEAKNEALESKQLHIVLMLWCVVLFLQTNIILFICDFLEIFSDFLVAREIITTVNLSQIPNADRANTS